MATPGKVRIQDGAGTDRITVDASSNIVLNGATVNSIQGDTVIGAAVMAGTEIFRVTGGSVLFDGVVGTVPASGAGTRLRWCPAKKAFRAGEVTSTQWDDANVGIGSAAFGYNTTASGSYSFAAGSGGLASAAYSACFGLGPIAYATSMLAFGQGTFADNGGVAQTTFVSLIAIATDDTPIECTLTGAAASATTRLLVEDGKTVAFILTAEARCTAGTDIGTSASWFMNGSIERTGATTRFVCTPWNLINDGSLSRADYSPSGATLDDAGLLTMTLTPTAANDALTITFVGHAGAATNTFHVTAGLTMTECK
jgi:hypothetical protein